jgi:SAM-dependent methyltransferase
VTTAGPGPRPRYGVDGFPYVVALSVAAALLPAGALTLWRGTRQRGLATAALAVGAAAAVPAALGIRYTARGKSALRERVLDAVRWRGDETVVDLGAGAGLLGLGAAGRTAGVVHCVDLFVAKDLSGNAPLRLWRNARALGVADRVRLYEVDVRRTGLPDASVDVVLSSLCLHNLADAAARATALDEVARILRPGGTVVISDLAHVDDEYAPHLARRGFRVRRVERVPGTFPPQRLLVATRPD